MKKIAILLALMLVLGIVFISGCTTTQNYTPSNSSGQSNSSNNPNYSSGNNSGQSNSSSTSGYLTAKIIKFES